MLRAIALAASILCAGLAAQAVTGQASASGASPEHDAGPSRALDCGKSGSVAADKTRRSKHACRLRPVLASRYADRYFMTSDGVRLHYLEGGANHSRTVVFIPGWTMPAWIWKAQLDSLSGQYHTVAFDPRGQGKSAVPSDGYEPQRRGRDIRELVDHLHTSPVVIVAWSLGVLDTLAMIHTGGDRGVSGLVLVDNSVGEEPPPSPGPKRAHPAHPARRVDHATYMRRFVAAMFHDHRSPEYLARLTAATLRTPEHASRLLLAYPVPRAYWREAVYATQVPLLYVVRPRWLAQGENLVRNRTNTELEVFTDAGHALFVDDAARFNALLAKFLRQKVWP